AVNEILAQWQWFPLGCGTMELRDSGQVVLLSKLKAVKVGRQSTQTAPCRSPTKRELMSAKIKWSIDADYLQACNCDYGCPCEFSAPPTPGFCEGMGAWRINRGNYGDVKLDGL